ncbi:MAG: alcohol dehydrogenase catalytic domain-containing protein [Christensenellales bacterium]|jgi:(R,R)-butanediol dehydrogenase/meso-butanediol dehydrogenase/diacetyl reductase
MTKLMDAVIFESIGKAAVVKKPIPCISKSTDVLLKVEIASICGTDMHILSDPPGFPAKMGTIIGHEYIGEIVELGNEVKDFKIGDRVALDPNLSCGSCYYCKMGKPNMCKNWICLGIDLDGGFAEYSLVPSKAIFKISKDLPAEVAIFAEPLVCIANSMEKIQLEVGETALVLGAGPIGLYFIMMLKAAGARKIIVSEMSEFRTKYAYECGATIVVNPMKGNLKEIINNETEDGVDVSVDAVGTLINDAIINTRCDGRILLFGMNSKSKQEICQFDITKKDLKILGNNISTYKFSSTINLLESRILPLEKLVTHRLSLKDIHQGFEAMRQGEALEVVLYP